MTEPSSAPRVRPLTTADIPAGVRLKAAAGWNQTEADWRNLLALAPGGCFGIECHGDLRATTTAVCFGQELAWIGMVLTQHEYRGRGFARRLMGHALAYLRARGVDWIKLDATNMGLPLYERLGFGAEGAIERWLRAPGPAPACGATHPYAPDIALDRAASGTDRSQLLAVLAGFESASSAGNGFAMGRPGSQAAYFGPCVARSADAARDLIAWFVTRHEEQSVYWDILPANRDAVAIAREFGFERSRELVRMAIPGVENPTPLMNNDALVFAIAGFEFG